MSQGVLSYFRNLSYRRITKTSRDEKTKWRTYVMITTYLVAILLILPYTTAAASEPNLGISLQGDDYEESPPTLAKTSEHLTTREWSHGTTHTEQDVQDVIQLIEDGKIYPILSQDESGFTTSDDRKENSLYYNYERLLSTDAYGTIILPKDRMKRDSTNKSTMKPEINSTDFNEYTTKIQHYRDTFLDSIAEDNYRKARRSAPKATDAKSPDTPAPKSPSKNRAKTGETILNIRSEVKDTISNVGSLNLDLSQNRNKVNTETSHLDKFIIHPSQYLSKDSTMAPTDNILASSLGLDFGVQKNSNDTDKNDLIKRFGSKLNSDLAKSKVSSENKEIFVEQQTKLTIECELSNNITVTSWTKDGHPVLLGPSAPTRVRSAGAGRAIIVERAIGDDAGLWACEGRDAAGRLHKGPPVNLLVYVEARAPYLALDGRRLDAGNTWAPAKEGHVLDILCVAEGGQPPAKLTWALVGGRGDADSRNMIISNHEQPDGSSRSAVRLTVSRTHHNATLECRAEQRTPATLRSYNVAAAALKLDVTYPPSFVISRTPGFGLPLVCGRAASLRCDVDANPPAAPRWRKDEPPTGAGVTETPATTPPPASTGTLYFPKLAVGHAGWYRCMADYAGTEYSSVGYFFNVRYIVQETTSTSELPPRNDDANIVDVDLGGSVQLHCPKGSVGCWSRRRYGVGGGVAEAVAAATRRHNASASLGAGSGPETNKLGWFPVGSTHAHGVLGVRGAIYEQAGEYRCVGASAEDLHKEKELRRITLNVNGAPVVYRIAPRGSAPDDEETTVSWGATALLAAQVCGRPAPRALIWLIATPAHPDRVLRPGDTVGDIVAEPLEPSSTSPSCWVASLRIVRAHAEHGGEYALLARGGGGRAGHAAEVTFMVRVAQPPGHQHATAAIDNAAGFVGAIKGAAVITILVVILST